MVFSGDRLRDTVNQRGARVRDHKLISVLVPLGIRSAFVSANCRENGNFRIMNGVIGSCTQCHGQCSQSGRDI